MVVSLRPSLALLVACCLLLAGCGLDTAPQLTPTPPPPVQRVGGASDRPTAAQAAVTATATPRSLLPALATMLLPGTTPTPAAAIRTVFLIVMENHNWSQIKGNANAPYLNKTLLPLAAHAEQYYNPPGLHPSEPNYLWLEAGTNFGIRNDADPKSNHQASKEHLVSLLANAAITWRSYQEGISGTACPLVAAGLYAPKHNPMIFFDDVTSANSPRSAYCVAHVRPYDELSTDLTNNTVARYNFITPNLCDDMHSAPSCVTGNSVQLGDNWLAGAVPQILASTAYKQNGVLFITWDEGLNGDGPIGLLALSPLARGAGYANSLRYTHSSLLRSLEEIFAVTPLLGDAATASDLGDLFAHFP